MGQDFRELFFIVVFFALAFAGVQWFLLKWTHWSIALAVTAFVAFCIAFLYVSLKHASPNGGSNGPSGSEFITPTFVVFAVLFCGFWGVAQLTKTELPKMAVVLPFGLIAILGTGRFVYQYVDNVTLSAQLFSSCKIELSNESGAEITVREISFNNTSSGLTTVIEPNSEEPPYPRIVRSVDRIIFLCYSSKTDNTFFQEFPFDYSVFKEKEGRPLGFCFWVKEKVVQPLKIVFRPENEVVLYVGGSLVAHYSLKEEEPTE